MSSRNILDGFWYQINNEKEFNNLLKYGEISPVSLDRMSCYRVQIGKYNGVGKYLMVTYTQRCPRNCCWDSVCELLSKKDAFQEIRNSIIDLSNLYKGGKG